MLPNWIHAGAGKCASSFLWRVCQGHPQVYVPTLPDNVNFFTLHYHRGLDWYQQAYFADYAGEPVAGEFSNSYMCTPYALDRIAHDLPHVKLTFCIRPPVERAFLSWTHQHLKNKPSGLDMRKGIGIPFDKLIHHHGHAIYRMYMEPGFYARHLKEVYARFPRERVKVMLQEDLAANAPGFLREYWRFLEVDESFDSPLLKEDINPDPPDMWDYLDPEVFAELTATVRDDVLELADMLDRDLSHWLELPAAAKAAHAAKTPQ